MTSEQCCTFGSKSLCYCYASKKYFFYLLASSKKQVFLPFYFLPSFLTETSVGGPSLGFLSLNSMMSSNLVSVRSGRIRVVNLGPGNPNLDPEYLSDIKKHGKNSKTTRRKKKHFFWRVNNNCQSWTCWAAPLFHRSRENTATTFPAWPTIK